MCLQYPELEEALALRLATAKPDGPVMVDGPLTVVPRHWHARNGLYSHARTCRDLISCCHFPSSFTGSASFIVASILENTLETNRSHLEDGRNGHLYRGVVN